jgi:hypothetical protein
MVYISKGIVCKESGINNLHVSRCGGKYNLLGDKAKLWLAGRFRLAYAADSVGQSGLRELESIGLVEAMEPNKTASYRLLTNCVICKENPIASFPLLNKTEKFIWKWIRNAGFKLTISELVYLVEQNIMPGTEFFGEKNWHTLINAIYTPEISSDCILDAKMAESSARNSTVSAVLGLLKKKHIILV